METYPRTLLTTQSAELVFNRLYGFLERFCGVEKA